MSGAGGQRRRFLWLLVCAASVGGLRAEGVLDRLDERLTVGGTGWSARASGTVDLEAYGFTGPAPALIDAEHGELWQPRLTLFLDGQAGGSVYAFAQARVDRGFDPAAAPLRGRLDEYALRVTPWRDGRLSVQAGKFATAIGSWVGRHASWENPFVTGPLPYENLTGIWDSVAAPSTGTVLAWAHVRPAHDGDTDEKYLRVPAIWGPDYATGVALSGTSGRFDYATEIKNSSPSARPGSWDASAAQWRHPTVSGRLGWRPDPRWNVGLSASDGVFLQPAAAPSVPAGRAFGDYRETLLGSDVGFAWHRLQLWSEVYLVNFRVPGVGSLRTTAGYAEAKMKLTPQLAAAVRINRQVFSDVTDGEGSRLAWGRDVWRFDVAPSFRFTPQIQWKLQYSLQREAGAPHAWTQLAATQLTVRF